MTVIVIINRWLIFFAIRSVTLVYVRLCWQLATRTVAICCPNSLDVLSFAKKRQDLVVRCLRFFPEKPKTIGWRRVEIPDCKKPKKSFCPRLGAAKIFMIHDFLSTKNHLFVLGWGKRVPRCMGAALVGGRGLVAWRGPWMLVVCMSGFWTLGWWVFICNLGMFWEDFVWEHSPFLYFLPKSIFQRGPKPCAPEVAWVSMISKSFDPMIPNVICISLHFWLLDYSSAFSI